jgi:two-component system, chemotaxis family, chemotaxis protein CheY
VKFERYECSFTVRLRVACDIERMKTVQTNNSTRRAEAALVVEDDEHMRDLLASMLRELGYARVLTASSVEHGFDVLASNNVAIVLVDLCLGAEDGCALIRGIREKESGRAELPVIVVSRAATESRIVAALSAGADGFIAKPLSMATFHRQVALATVKRELSRRGATQSRNPSHETLAAFRQPSVIEVD